MTWIDTDDNNNHEEINQSNSGPFEFDQYSIEFIFRTEMVPRRLSGDIADITPDSSAPPRPR